MSIKGSPNQGGIIHTGDENDATLGTIRPLKKKERERKTKGRGEGRIQRSRRSNGERGGGYWDNFFPNIHLGGGNLYQKRTARKGRRGRRPRVKKDTTNEDSPPPVMRWNSSFLNSRWGGGREIEMRIPVSHWESQCERGIGRASGMAAQKEAALHLVGTRERVARFR